MKKQAIALLIISFFFNSIESASEGSPIVISEMRIDELAKWFASGMQETEKDYQKKSKKIKVDSSRYTQTEAYMKLLVDIYHYEITLGHVRKEGNLFADSDFWKKNPPPKVNTLHDLREHEDELINWVLKISKTKLNSPKKDILQSFIPLVKNILKKEKEHGDDYVFYHASSFSFSIIYDLLSEIENFLFYSPKIFNSENITDVSPKESIFRLRHFDSNNSKYKNVDEFLKAWQPDWNDADAELNLLSTNFSLFGNTGRLMGESTFAYFVLSKSGPASRFYKSSLIDKVFDYLKFDAKYKKDLDDLYDNFMKSASGNLSQIFIPRDLVNKFVYLSVPYGYPIGMPPVDEYAMQINYALLEKIINDGKKFTTLEGLDFYRKANFPDNDLYDLEALQTRILLVPGFFDLDNGIKIFKYTTAELEGEFGADYKKGLRFLVAKMMISYILQHPKEIQEGSETAMKNILESIMQWQEAKPKAK